MQITSFKNASAVYKKREEYLLGDSTDWCTTDIVVSDEDLPGVGYCSFRFQHRNVENALKEICSNSALKHSFDVKIRKKIINIGGVDTRIFDETVNCDAAIAQQKKIKALASQIDESHSQHAVALLIQLYSDKTLLNVKGATCHPIRLTIMNIKRRCRHQFTEVVGYFPDLGGHDRITKLLVLQKCIKALFASIEDGLKAGYQWKAPDGKKFWFFPRVISYVADDPEIRDILCIKSHQGSLPCERCTVTKEQLDVILDGSSNNSNNNNTGNNRTSQQTKMLVQDAIEKITTKKELNTISKDLGDNHSVVPVLSHMHLLHEGDMHLLFGYDTLHNEDLGLIPDIVTASCEWVHKRWPGKGFTYIYKHMNDMLQQIRKQSSIILPANDYFPNRTHAQAVEHRGVLQLLPHILLALHPLLADASKNTKSEDASVLRAELDGIIRAVAGYATCYIVCHRKHKHSYYTEAELADDRTAEGTLIALIHEANESFKIYLAPYLKSNGKTIKRHRHLNHFVSTIKWLGHPSNYSSQHHEAQHKEEKVSYRLSARKPDDIEAGIIRHRINARVFTLPAKRSSPAKKDSPLMKAKRSGTHHLVQNGLSIDVAWVGKADGNLLTTNDAHIATVIEKRPVLKKVPDLLKKYAEKVFQPTGSCSLKLGSSITLVSSAALAAKNVPGAEGSIVFQTIRASHSYHKKEKFDYCYVTSNRYAGPTASSGCVTIAQILALFHCDVEGNSQQFALVVEMGKGANNREKSVLDEFGCDILEDTQRYEVVHLSKIQRRVDLIPPLHANGKLRFNNFRWYDTRDSIDDNPDDVSESSAEDRGSKRQRV